ncbi:MAG: glycosyltransferase [bacterium]
MMNNKNKLLYIHSSNISPAKRGGLNTTLLQVFSMCNAFPSAGYNVTLAMEGDNQFDKNLNEFIKNSFEKDISFSIIHWKQVHSKRLINRILVKSKIIKIIKKQKPDIIFTRESFILTSLVKLNIPVIFESHNAKLHTKYKFIHQYLKKKVIKASKSSNFKCLFSISKALSKYWESNGVPKQKLFSWHDGFDQSLFKETQEKSIARNKLKLPKDKTIVTYTGGLYPDREIDNIIKLAKEKPEVYFLVIGGPEKNRLHYQSFAKSNQVKNIHFPGYVEHRLIPQYLYASDILLALWSTKVPTINYCSPLKLFEYMAAGRVLLAHSFPTIKEVLTDEVDAVFCEPQNFQSLKSKLDKAIKESKTNKLGLNARKKALELYSWDTRVKKLIEFIKND